MPFFSRLEAFRIESWPIDRLRLHDGKTVDYRSVAEIDCAIEALDHDIAAAEGRRIVRQRRVTTSKGL
jgi:hypothetical protein